MRALTRFTLFGQRTGVPALAGIDQATLERYLADLHAELAGRQHHGDHIGQLSAFLHAVRQPKSHGEMPTPTVDAITIKVVSTA